ncbi:hypothetical protein HG531_010103 [Fusarium graminearum]|nr:hypothetical protein HG531_010103 [Fusarium graminearum]
MVILSHLRSFCLFNCCKPLFARKQPLHEINVPKLLKQPFVRALLVALFHHGTSDLGKNSPGSCSGTKTVPVLTLHGSLFFFDPDDSADFGQSCAPVGVENTILCFLEELLFVLFPRFGRDQRPLLLNTGNGRLKASHGCI